MCRIFTKKKKNNINKRFGFIYHEMIINKKRNKKKQFNKNISYRYYNIKIEYL